MNEFGSSLIAETLSIIEDLDIGGMWFDNTLYALKHHIDIWKDDLSYIATNHPDAFSEAKVDVTDYVPFML